MLQHAMIVTYLHLGRCFKALGRMEHWSSAIAHSARLCEAGGAATAHLLPSVTAMLHMPCTQGNSPGGVIGASHGTTLTDQPMHVSFHSVQMYGPESACMSSRSMNSASCKPGSTVAGLPASTPKRGSRPPPNVHTPSPKWRVAPPQASPPSRHETASPSNPLAKRTIRPSPLLTR